MHTTLVSTSQLASHLADWATVDCRFDLHDEAWGRDQYLASHIPGAVYANLNDDLSGPRTGRNGRHPLPALEALASTLGRLGISNDTQVVAYDQDSGMYASRLWWLLRFAGHRAAAVLDGGWTTWTREGRPTHSGQEQRRPVIFTPGTPLEEPVLIDETAAAVRDHQRVLVDARAPERYEGRVEPIDRVPGHIPGAVNRFFKDNLTQDGTFKPPDTLREQFTKVLAGHEPTQAILYCGSGVTACHNVLAMEHAGLHGARLYPGSWSEWSSDPSRPIVKA
ncbi:MAG TPA: sulfurtransferase [Vicinamibacterales bacterium]|nr:sulfurtransferase [Vicinamibacterales bacterium]